jgi:hypothetical protein
MLIIPLSLLNDGRIIIIAGYNGLTNLTSIEAFDTETLEFTTVADLSSRKIVSQISAASRRTSAYHGRL